MASLREDRFFRFKRACEIIETMLDSSSLSMLRRAEALGCLLEYEIIREDLRLWFNDDAYFDELAWEFDQKDAV